MPELPEVETVVRALTPALRGRAIRSVRVRHQPSVQGSLVPLEQAVGETIVGLRRRAKYICVELSGGLGLVVHLRMTGWLGVLAAEQRDAKLDAYERVRFELDDGRQALVFRDIRTFGRIWCGASGALMALPALAKLGPEPFEITPDVFAARLRARGGRLKSVLLDQTFLAGVGNIYADEALHGASLHPLTRASQVKALRAQALLETIQEILKRSIAAGGSSVVDFVRPDGQKGWFQRELAVYGREGEACGRCGGAITRIVVGQRGTWFCPKCQKRR